MGISNNPALNPSPSSNTMSSSWNALWSSNISLKVKIIWWRLVHDFIPTTWNLNQHHKPAILSCALCGNGEETTLHGIFLCSAMKPIWKSSKWSQLLEVARHGSMIDLVVWARGVWSKYEFELFAMSVWEAWNTLNH